MPKPRILLYSHDTYGLGHLRRSLAIAQSISQHIPRSRQLLVTGSTVAGAFAMPPRLDIIKLPSLSKRSSGEYMPRTLPLPLGQTIHWRKEMIYQAVLHFQPDLILVDKAPAGVQGELLMTLEHVKQRLPKTRIVLGMRDIEDDPESTRREWVENNITAVLEKFYDAILLYGDRTVFDPVQAYDLPEEVAGRVVESGYIARYLHFRPFRLARRELGLGTEPFVLITAGGGGDGFGLVNAAIKMFEQGLAGGIFPMVVTGPLMPQHHRKTLSERAQAVGVRLIEFTPNLIQYMHAADLVVGMAGYNTACEILSLQKRAVLVPRSQVRQEQKIRAGRLAELGLTRMLPPEKLSAESLWQEIEAGLADSPPIVGLNMDGLANATRAIAALLKTPDTFPYLLPSEIFTTGMRRQVNFPA